jgi:drug/metabolite transporter (DMT)-like permease
MDLQNQHRMRAHLAGVLFSLLVGFSFMSVKICVPIATPLEILAFRYSFAFLAAIAVAAALYRKKPIRLRKFGDAGLWLVVFLYVGFMVLQVAGLERSTSVEGSILFAIIPIFAKILARVILGERSTLIQDLFMTLSITALIVMLVLGATDLHFNMAGAALLVAASAFMAGSNVLMRQIKGRFTPFEITFAISVSGFVVFAAAALIKGAADGTLSGSLQLVKNRDFMLATAYLGIFCIMMTSQLMSYMMAHMPAVQGTLYGNLSTAISIVAGVVILSEPLEPYHILCTLLIVAGVIGISISGMKSSRTASPAMADPLKKGETP